MKNTTVKKILSVILLAAVLLMTVACGSETTVCPNCGEENPEDAKYCSLCGAALVYGGSEHSDGSSNPDAGNGGENGKDGDDGDDGDDGSPALFKRTPEAETVISQDTVYTATDGGFCRIVEVNGDLTVEEGVQITSSDISQLVFVVNGTLTMKKNAAIRVRNGFYSDAPEKQISQLTDDQIAQMPKNSDGILLLEGYYGKGGNGGQGGDGFAGSASSYCAGGNAGCGGAGGFGGGVSGEDGYSGRDGFTAHNGEKGYAAGDPGYAAKSNTIGRIVTYNDNEYSGPAGDGNGGNAGGSGMSAYQSIGGFGGGGGGYGGGVLSIYAKKIVVEESETPAFVVLGQYGGLCGFNLYGVIRGSNPKNGATDGNNGEGGLLLIRCEEYEYQPSHWESAYGRTEYRNPYTGKTGKDVVCSEFAGGHSSLVASVPQLVVINGKSVDKGLSNVEIYGSSEVGKGGGPSGGSGSSGSGSGNGGVVSPGGGSSGNIGNTPCYHCNQTGQVKCGACDGTGKVWGVLGKQKVNCTMCSGTGKRPCAYCGGDGIFGYR